MLGSSKKGDIFPENFRRVRLYLAREPAHPLGSRDIGCDLVIPLTPEGKIDPAVCKERPDYGRFIGFRCGEDDEAGHLVSRPGGSWVFHYDLRGEEDGCHTYVLALVEKF